MDVADSAEASPGSLLEADLAIVGGGPAGLAIARALINIPLRVLILESGGLEQSDFAETQNEVETPPGLWSAAQAKMRRAFHGASAPFWTHERQGFGVRCRALGGATAAWAGKSASFDAIDFEARAWAPGSGWPIDRAAIAPYIDAAANELNLGPNLYDDALWDVIGARPAGAEPDPTELRSFFWQFARSRLNGMDVLRAGKDFMHPEAPNVRVLLHATVAQIHTTQSGARFRRLEVLRRDGARFEVAAKACVLAAGAIENVRLLLASRAQHDNGLGNGRDMVGRCLMDHPSAAIAHFRPQDIPALADRFGFYAVRDQARVHMYMRGLAPAPAVQAREGILNCALYMMQERAADDPWEALKRLVRLKSSRPLADMGAIAASPGLIVKGLGRRAMQSRFMPRAVSEFTVQTLIRFNPNFVAQEFQTGGLPHKLAGLRVDAITEQLPDRQNRITLSHKRDRLGQFLPKAEWRVGERERATLARLGRLLHAEFQRAGLPAPLLAPWIETNSLDDATIIDMAHTAGVTRMSAAPSDGVVDEHCQVHGVSGLYIAGGAVFPTSGHANPTLMIVALALRLADRLRRNLTGVEATVERETQA